MNSLRGKVIVVDSCVLLYCEASPLKDFIRKLLRSLKDNNNKLFISELSGFEVLKNIQKQKYFDYYIMLLDYIDNIPVDVKVLSNSYLLHKSYKKHNKINNKQSLLNSFDIIIGGSVITYKDALLLTANKKDFPKPFWKIVKNDYGIYELSKEYKVLNLYLLEPDIGLINNYSKK